MKIVLAVVGRARKPLVDAIAAYEKRIGHYYSFEAVEVPEVPHRGQPVPQLLEDEGQRLLARVPHPYQLVALDRLGARWSSEELARYLSDLALHATPGVAFVIGGAYGLASTVLQRANRQWSLSSLTFPHELARLVVAEQIYRAGTIGRGEPYHKASQR